MNEEVVACLEHVKEILGKNGEHWTHGSYARTDDDTPVEISSPAAAKFCLVGAFIKANCPADFEARQVLQHAIDADPHTAVSDKSLIYFNDRQLSFESVKKSLILAIEMAKKEV